MQRDNLIRLSIIIPVYNVEKYISRCLDSLLDQDLHTSDYEIIVVNDGSNDKSLEIAQSYARNNNVIIIDQKNGGVGNARNSGLMAARGNYVYFIDPDDYLISNCLNKLVTSCEANNLDILTFLSTSFFPSTSNDKPVKTKPTFRISFSDKELSPIVTGEDFIASVKYNSNVWWYFIDRKFLIDSGIRFIQGRWMEDAIFTLEILLAAKGVAHLKLDVHRYMVAPGTAMTSKEQNHYLKIIRDNQNAALVFDPIIKALENRKANSDCINRIKARQQSFVFFLMVRMIQSTIKFNEAQSIMNDMSDINAYPLDLFLGDDYSDISYYILVKLFNTKSRFYFFFLLLNPLFKFRYILLKPI